MTSLDMPKLYQGYEIWKGWSDLFSYTLDERDYYTGETKGMKIFGARLLEIGFGSGSFLSWAADNGASVVGTEVNPVLADAARSRGFEVLDTNLCLICQHSAPQFDTIVALDVFEHLSISEIVSYLDALEQMLKPGGSILLRFPNGQSPFGLAPQNGDTTHRTALSLSIFEQLIEQRPFQVVRYSPPFMPRGHKISVFCARIMRSGLRLIISRLLNFVYATDIPYDAVVTLVLNRN